MDTIVLATNNKGKIREFAELLKPLGVEVKPLSDFPEIGDIVEDGETFRDNALIKARTVCKATGLVAVADDSGLEVDHLGGAPGVYSARFAGDGHDDHANNEKLLKELDGVPDEKRTARYRCIMAAVAPNGEEITTEGSYEGRIGYEYRGEGGFGYDVIFVDPELGRHVAEISAELKHSRSHRGKAIRRMLEIWPGFWEKARK
ncbi:XTP/dITP diphosphatase [Salidesulfovibrio onnuriiensis]|uniref:XTP/dITP diphosphatase n=1 Tax=Salidesulfovibrio onnuriiensis TaxID=2583823 RepID=UPI0011CA7C1A|nr:XTP/dITP diphosphatase [Salidesulfovibrio onnuriiensis]